MNKLLLLLCSVAIFALGLVMIFSTTSADVLDRDLNVTTHYALIKQGFYAMIGLILALYCYRQGYEKLLKLSPYFFWLFIFLLVCVLIPGVGREVNGSRRWLGILGFTFQPSEFVKYIVPGFFIHRLAEWGGKEIPFKKFIQLISLTLIPVLLIMVEPNNGTAAVILLTIVLLCFIMEVRFTYWALPLSIMLVVGGTFASQLPYFSQRIKVYLQPELDLRGKGHQPYQAKIAAGSGKLWGKGPGNSWQKLSYLPEAQNDYIAAIYAEEMGFFGIAFLIFLYMLCAYLGFSIASQAKDPQGCYYASVITFLISFQAFLNLGVVSGLLPSTGLNLPWFSQGGTSLMANLMGLGLLLSIDKLNSSLYNSTPQSETVKVTN